MDELSDLADLTAHLDSLTMRRCTGEPSSRVLKRRQAERNVTTTVLDDLMGSEFGDRLVMRSRFSQRRVDRCGLSYRAFQPIDPAAKRASQSN